jgi:hypothetical protein
MSNELKNKLLVFIHQPKTGGLTLKTVIRRKYPWQAIFEIDDVSPETIQASLNELRARKPEDKQRIRCVLGHMPMGVHHFLPREPVYITMLRDPVERSISHYYHIYSHTRNWGQEDIVAKKATIEDYLTWTDEYGFSNLQTRCLVDPPVELWDNIVGPHPPLEASALEEAKKNLMERFAACGTVERYDETLLVMKKALGWRNMFYGKVNVTRGRKPRAEISASTIARIEELNWMDLELWKFVNTELLDAQIEKYGPSFEEDLRAFEVWNKRYVPVRRASKVIEEIRVKVRLRTRLRKVLAGA